jgi:hypothetical protein
LRSIALNIQKFYVLLTLRVCVLYGSQNKQRLLPYTALGDWFCITDVDSVYCAVRTELLYKTETSMLQRVKLDHNVKVCRYKLVAKDL